MTLALPSLAAALIDAMNLHDRAALLACFAPDAVVYDEDRTHRGTTAIGDWLEETSRNYRFTLEPIAVAGTASDLRLTANVTGDFDGSPVQLRYRLVIAHEKITLLAITP